MKPAPRKFLFVLSYEGTRFAGWQRQKNARSVQQTLEEALGQITGSPVSVTGAGRTDSGVHAEAQVAHAVLRTRLAPAVLQRALNWTLPEDVAVRQLRPADPKFHARFSAKRKLYRYRIWNDPVRPVFERHRAYLVSEPLDLARMRRAARQLVGRRDFAAFHSAGRPVASTVRTMHALTIRRAGPLVTIDLEADGFLYHMARRIVGTLIEIGKGNPAPKIAPTAPAKGLCLVEIRYAKISRR